MQIKEILKQKSRRGIIGTRFLLLIIGNNLCYCLQGRKNFARRCKQLTEAA